MPTISVAIVTKNEEANILRCLESVKWADEFVIVDCGSTDGTLDICREHGCRIIEREWEGYAGQKNFAIAQTTTDWVLSLDADEEVTPELAQEIRAAVESVAADAYEMPRLSRFLGKWMRHGGWYPDRQLRLFKRGFGSFKIVPVHEHVVLREGATLGRLRHPLLHYTYPTVQDFVRKSDAYTDIEVQARVAANRIPRWIGLALMTAFPGKFVEVYLYKQGWRDGLHGFVAAVMIASRVHMRMAKLWAHTMKDLE